MLSLMPKSSLLMFVLPLVLAIGGPLAYFKLLDPAKTPAATASGDVLSTAVVSTDPAAGGAAAAPLSIPAGPATPSAGVRVQDASTVFNFEITPEWILARWPSVSTGLADLELEGYRVPLVTGTAQHDLAGSLSYYYDAKQKLQRITFVGTSGDPRLLIGLLASRFRMTRRLTNDPGLVVYEGVQSRPGPMSRLQIRVAQLAPGDTYRRYDIEVSLERPEE